jgi:hypothetical protein
MDFNTSAILSDFREQSENKWPKDRSENIKKLIDPFGRGFADSIRLRA